MAAIGGGAEMADSSGTEARQFYLLMGLFAGESQTLMQEWKSCDTEGLSHKIRVADPFLGLLNTEPNLLVRGTDPAPKPSIIKQSS